MWVYEVFIKKGIKIIDPKIGEINCEDIDGIVFDGEIKNKIKSVKIEKQNEDEIHLILELDDYIEGRILCKYIEEYLEPDILTEILSYIVGIPLGILSLIFAILLYIASIFFVIGILLLPFIIILLPFVVLIHFL